jgi:hypothetical protein
VDQPWWNDDERLLCALGDALRTAREVPPSFIEAGKIAYAWHNIDAELADLTYDSQRGLEPSERATRADSAALRALTFAAPALTIELEVSHDAIRGQLIPPQAGRIQVCTKSGPGATSTADEVGYFTIRPLPTGAFRLACDVGGPVPVHTSWIEL